MECAAPDGCFSQFPEYGVRVGMDFDGLEATVVARGGKHLPGREDA